MKVFSINPIITSNLRNYQELCDEKLAHVTLGAKVSIVKYIRKNKSTKFSGKVIYKNSHFITVQNDQNRKYTVPVVDVIRRTTRMEVADV